MKKIGMGVLRLILLPSLFLFRPGDAEVLDRYTPKVFLPNQFTYAYDTDESYLRFLVSTKFPLFWITRMREKEEVNLFAFNLAYTGMYDFFAFPTSKDRNSGPVISRLQNPGLYLEFKTDFLNLKKLRLGYFHESNGQSVNSDSLYRQMPPMIADDYVSMGWDYYWVESEWSKEFSTRYLEHLSVTPAVRIYAQEGYSLFQGGIEDTVFRYSPRKSYGIWDFDTYRVNIRTNLNLPFIYDAYVWVYRWFSKSATPEFDMKQLLSLRCGYMLRNWSFRFETMMRAKVGFGKFYTDIPYYLYYSNGYGKQISTYYQPDNEFGFGVQLYNW